MKGQSRDAEELAVRASQLEVALRRGLADVGCDVSPGSRADQAITKHLAPLKDPDGEQRPALRLVAGGKDTGASVKGEDMTVEDVYAIALDILQAAAEAPTKTDAIFDVRAVLADCDTAALRRVAGCLAVEPMWRPKVNRSALVDWISAVRLEVAFQAPDRRGDS
ncbi:hypothetical protein [Kribbella deserti]|uniref:DUF222 domain-containing protein n=1 Tax=Kribbella deserti TaxID=1926257 RepID=A0ABV6QF01_9ACTN